jgi:TrmH family RNA methyltransferase
MADGGSVYTERTPRVVAARKLLRRVGRERSGRFLAEGAQAVGAALASAGLASASDGPSNGPGTVTNGQAGGQVPPARVFELFATETAATRHAELVAAANLAGVTVSFITDRAASALSETVTPQGLLAVCGLFDMPLADALVGAPRQVVILVNASDPGNAGTVIRVADAAGADAVIFAGDSVDPHNGKCVRSSAGSVFHLPIARERDLGAVLRTCRDMGLSLLAATAAGELDLHDRAAEAVLTEPCAWLFGSEAHGLPASVASIADKRVRVPIYGRAESLNLATAASICVYGTAHAQRTARI